MREKESPSQESPINRVAYTLEQWDQEVVPFVGANKRLQPMIYESDNQFNYIKDTETGAVYRYNFEKQQGSTTGERHGGKPAPMPRETTWVNCIKEN